MRIWCRRARRGVRLGREAARSPVGGEGKLGGESVRVSVRAAVEFGFGKFRLGFFVMGHWTDGGEEGGARWLRDPRELFVGRQCPCCCALICGVVECQRYAF